MSKSEEELSEINRKNGRKGGLISGPRVREEHMDLLHRLGGLAISRDVEHMREIGRKGGLSVSHDREHMRKIGRMGGKAKRFNYDDW